MLDFQRLLQNHVQKELQHRLNIIINLMHATIYFAFEISVETIGL